MAGPQNSHGHNHGMDSARAKVEQMKKQWAQKKLVADTLAAVGTKIGVYSGKGGVGKTTVSVNLAVTLAQAGKDVGILDVDIDCPNVVRALAVTEKPEVGEDNRMIPPEAFGVKVMSMAFFQKKEDEAIIWRGPMIHNAINQLLQSTNWGELDYLIVDLPPGTSDSPLTVMQTLSLDGFVVVTTPQDLSKIDALRSINMIKKLNIPVLGVVENFTGEIFGTGAGKALANLAKVDHLGNLSLKIDYRESVKPTVLTSADVKQEYELVASNTLNVLK